MRNQIDEQRITREMRDDLEALGSAADMIEVLCEATDEQARSIERYIEQHGGLKLGDWRCIYTFLVLAGQQASLIKNTLERFELFDISKIEAIAA